MKTEKNYKLNQATRSHFQQSGMQVCGRRRPSILEEWCTEQEKERHLFAAEVVLSGYWQSTNQVHQSVHYYFVP